MIIYETKSELLTRKILVHVAQHGLSDLTSFSKLSKSIKVGRSLLYFYFKHETDIIDALYEVFTKEITYHYNYLNERQFNFDEYLNYLVDMKDSYFMMLECIKVQDQRQEFRPFGDYAFNTIDRYAQKVFIQKYQLDALPQERLDYMYNSLRCYWFKCSGAYEDWSYNKVSELREELDEFIEGLKSDFATIV
ncbi:MAG: hypothetical protein CMH49_07665 [Myxococcales bacterium]|nr:hypothetical protein [Myxococcales bacterium]